MTLGTLPDESKARFGAIAPQNMTVYWDDRARIQAKGIGLSMHESLCKRSVGMYSITANAAGCARNADAHDAHLVGTVLFDLSVNQQCYRLI